IYSSTSRISTENTSSRSMSQNFFFQAEDGIRDKLVTGVQTCALPIWSTSSKVRSTSGAHSAWRLRLTSRSQLGEELFWRHEEGILPQDSANDHEGMGTYNIDHRVAKIGRASCRERGQAATDEVERIEE